jgi:hypothetical protein
MFPRHVWGGVYLVSRMMLPAGTRVVYKIEKSRYDLDMGGF